MGRGNGNGYPTQREVADPGKRNQRSPSRQQNNFPVVVSSIRVGKVRKCSKNTLCIRRKQGIITKEGLKMKTAVATFRNVSHLLSLLALSVALAACGGGGTSSTSPGLSGSAMLSVSVASAPGYPAGTTFAPSTLSPGTAAPANSPNFDNVFVWVNKLALIPSNSAGSPDGNGELEQVNPSAEEGRSGMPGFVTITLPEPVRIDLRNPPTGRQVAILLNKFSESPVPAGEYTKIRIYYDNVVGHTAEADTVFHPTAHYHFDVHFVGGNLVIPVAAPQDGVRFHSIVIKGGGLKTNWAGGRGKNLLRPTGFAVF